MNKRGQAALNRQGILNEFLDISAGSGTYAPRKNRVYESKRLQQVISEFRKKKRQKIGSNTPVLASQSGDSGQDESEGMSEFEEGMGRKRQKKSSTTTKGSTVKKKGRTTASSTSRGKRKTDASSAAVARGSGGRERGKGRGGTGRTQARKSKAQESSSELSEGDMDADGNGDSEVFVPGLAKDSVAGKAGELALRPRPRPRPTYRGVVPDPVAELTGGEISVLNVAPFVAPSEATMED